MIKKIEIPIYNQKIWICDVMPEKYKNDYGAIFDYEKWTLYYNSGHWHHARCCHECVHIAGQLCKRLMIIYEPDNDEAFAYLVEFLYKKIWAITKKK